MNSETETEIERLLRHTARQIPKDTEMSELILSRIETMIPPKPQSRFISRRWLIGSLTAAAAAVAIAVVLLPTGAASSLAYAQVVQAMEKVQTARLDVTQPVGDGKSPDETATYFFDRRAGLRMEGKLNGTAILFIDNFKRQWIRTGDAGDLQESASMGSRDIFDELLLARDMLEGAKRDPAGDETIDGVRCRLFAKPAKDNVIASRVWLDDDDRVRKMETGEMRDEKWHIRQSVVAHLNVAVEAKLFEPPVIAATSPAADSLPLDQRIVREFSLEKTLVQREVLGLTLAVHSVRRGDDGSVLVFSSLRPTDETTKKFPKRWPGFHPLGDHQISVQSPAKYNVIPVGEFHSDRLYGRWDLLVPYAALAEVPTKIEINADVYTRDELSDALKKERANERKKDYVNDFKLQPIELPQEKLPFAELVNTYWSQARPLHSMFTPVHSWEATKKTKDGYIADVHPLDQWKPEKLISELTKSIENNRQRHQKWLQDQEAKKLDAK